VCELCKDDLVHEQIGVFAKNHEFSIDIRRQRLPRIRNCDLEYVAQLSTANQVLCFLRQRWGDYLRLELGAGKKDKNGPPWGKYPFPTMGLTQRADPNCDIYSNLDEVWYDDEFYEDKPPKVIPLPDECVHEIHANQVMEHIHNIIPLMNDCYRVLVPGGFVHICVPYYLGPHAWGDPTHVRAYSETSFQYYCRRENGAQFTEQFSDYGITAMFVQESLEKQGNAGLSVILRKPLE